MKAVFANALTLAGSILAHPVRDAQLSACKSQTQSNPIAAQYPNLPTGVLNGTIAVLPVKYEVARQFVPAQYPILTHAYESLLPWWPKDMYPIIMQQNIDHDVKEGSAEPDALALQFSRGALYFPFVNYLKDGYTSFNYQDAILISDNPVAIAGSLLYGDTIYASQFDPPCDGWRYFGSETGFDVTPLLGNLTNTASLSGRFERKQGSPFDIDFWRNVTNQPVVSKVPICDNFIRLFNTSVSEDLVDVQGTVTETDLIKPGKSNTFQNVWAIQGAQAFVEKNFQDCDSLQGYSGS